MAQSTSFGNKAKLNSIIDVTEPQYWNTGDDFSVALQRAIDALPATGGIIHAEGVIGNQTISAQVTFNKPVTLYLGPAQFTVASTATSPALNITKTSSIIGQTSGRLKDANADIRGWYGTHFVAGSGFTGYVFGVTNAVGASTDQFNAAKSSIENLSIDGNVKAASGIRIEASFNVRVRRVTISNVTNGIYALNNAGGQGWTEGTNFEEVYIENPTRGIYLDGSAGATDSFGHASWSGIRISLVVASSIAIYLKEAALYSSLIEGIIIWAADTADNSVGIQIENIELTPGTVFSKVFFEVGAGTTGFAGWYNAGSAPFGLPTILGTTLAGAGDLYFSMPAATTFWNIKRGLSLNGDFEVGTAGWTSNANAVLSSVANGQTGKCLRVTCDNIPTADARAHFNRIGVPGMRYKVTVWFKVGTAPTGLIRVGVSNGDNTFGSVTPSDVAWTKYEFTFKASSTGAIFVTLYANGTADTANLYSDYDSIEIEELGWSLDA